MPPTPDRAPPPPPEPRPAPQPAPEPAPVVGRPPRGTRPQANRVFTNRDRPIAHFDRARAGLPTAVYRILGFYGVGGQGKTALRRHLIERLRLAPDPGQRFGVLDFQTESYRDPAPGLLALRRSLRESGAIRCDIFDVAIARYWGLAYPGQDLTRALGDLLGDPDGVLGGLLEGARDWLGLAEELPAGLGLGVKAVNQVRQRLRERGAEAACAALRDLERLEPDQIVAQLPRFLGLDLEAHRARYPEAPAPICFIDTYEALWSEAPVKTGLGSAETDAWVRDLVAQAPGVLFVILGRERLTWDQRFPHHWAGLLADQHLLGGLAEVDAERFLVGIPIPDPAVRRAIIAGAGAGAGADVGEDATPGAQGAHPFYLDLAVDTWLDLIGTPAGPTPTPADFGATHPQVLERFLRHRAPAEREALKVLAGPAGFDRALFAALLERFRIPYPLTAFEDLCDLSIIEPGADGRLHLHGLMRTHLLAELTPALRADLDAFLFDRYDARCQPAGPRDLGPGHEEALREAVAHRDTGDAEAALGWFWGRQRVFDDAARHALLEPLHRWALALAESQLGAEHPQTAVALNNLALLLKTTNRLAEAEPLMRRALAIDEAGYGAEHPDVAIDLNNLAQLLKATNRLAEAEPLMRRALAIDEAGYGAEHPAVAIDLNNLAQLLQATNRLAEAEPLMRRALAIDEAGYGAEHPKVALRLNNLAQLLQATNRLAEAEPLMRRALAIDEAGYGAEHPAVACDLNNLAQLLKATNRLAEAEPLMRRALAIDEAGYGAEHPDVAIDLNNLAALLWATNRLAEAEPLMRRALAIDEASYGAGHPDVASDLNNLAQLLAATNRLAEAEPLSRRMLLILLAFTRDTGHRHPNLRVGFANYRRLLLALDPDAAPQRIADLGAEAGLEPTTWQGLLDGFLAESGGDG